MKITVLLVVLLCLCACNKATHPSTSANVIPSTAATSGSSNAVQQKLKDFAGSVATDCGSLDGRATADQLQSASDCAMQASQGKHPFAVAYNMPGMSVGVAGNSDGKLYTAQSQGSDASAVTAGNCPSQLRVASSGRITCFAPGDMGSMSGSHAAGSMPPGMPNAHGGSAKPTNK